ncbi:MAG: LuxR C-terminal-related transcriptional regulator [Colwellia sp.]|nr:LuxR C-terminal-related transcriptional regulator [Colwellia sp.]
MDRFLSKQTSELPCDLLDYTARCIEHSGSREFFVPFFDMIHHLFEVDQCMVFFLGASSRIECLLSRDFTDDLIANSLASAYLDDGYNSDPNLSTLNRLSIGETKVTHLKDLQEGMLDSYRERFFNEPHLIDKVSILTADKSGKYYINLYRRKGRPSFIEQQLFDDPAKARLLAAIITQHYRINQSLNNEGPLAFLSERERQVCQGILRGKKMEAVSAEVGIATSSAITYKKRAYVKLGITSRTSLFNLCHKN